MPPGSEKTIIGVAPAPSVTRGDEDDDDDNRDPGDSHETVLAQRRPPSRASEPTVLAGPDDDRSLARPREARMGESSGGGPPYGGPIRGGAPSSGRPSEPTILAVPDDDRSTGGGPASGAPRISDPALPGLPPVRPPAPGSRADEATVLAQPISPVPRPNGAVPQFPPRPLAGSAPVAAPKFPPLRPVPQVPAFRPQPNSYPRPIARAETEVGEVSRRRTWIVVVLLAAMISLAAVLAYVQLEL